MDMPMPANLFEDARKDKWDDVYRACERSPELLIAKVDKSHNTILHVAVLKRKAEAVKHLVNLTKEKIMVMGGDAFAKVLGAQNDKGNADAVKDPATSTEDKKREWCKEVVLGAKNDKGNNTDPVENPATLTEDEKLEWCKEVVLGAKNDKGNTPLHLAAAYGFEEMCASLAEACPQLIKLQNNDKETPYFFSARRGRKVAFLLLHRICKEHITDALRKTDGNTILHAAINGEFFELAYIIVQKYKTRKQINLINVHDERGRVPLHILAEKPHAFPSGNPPGTSNWILYQCVDVTLPKLNPDKSDARDAEPKKNHQNYKTCMDDTLTKLDKCTETKKWPQNYETCMEFIRSIGKGLRLLIGFPNRNDGGTDIEIDGGSNFYPPNYETLVHLLKFIVKLLLVILGFGIPTASKIEERKKQHYWANLVAKELIQVDRTYHFQADGGNPATSLPKELSIFGADSITTEAETSEPKPPDYATIVANIWGATQKRDINNMDALKKGLMDLTAKIRQDVAQYEMMAQEVDAPSNKNPTRLTLEKRDARSGSVKETPFLVAARTGIIEIVMGLLEQYPTAIHDMDAKEKNALLLAVEHRQTHVFNLLWTDKDKISTDILLQQVDNDGNTALHLAAICSEHHPHTPGAAFRMMWETKWFTFVKGVMPPGYESRRNEKGQTPHEVLTSTHEELVTKAGEWLTKTSESCSLVSALIATVAFATSATIPGGFDSGKGEPTLKNKTLFHVFTISSLVALCSSVTATVLFLVILTSRFQESDFEKRLPRRLLWGMTTLFMSIVAILVSFCAGHFFLVQESVESFAYPIYFATCLPVTYFGLAQVPLYFDLLRSIFYPDPQASYKH